MLGQDVGPGETEIRPIDGLQGRVRFSEPTLYREKIGLGAYLTSVRGSSPVFDLREDRRQPGYGRYIVPRLAGGVASTQLSARSPPRPVGVFKVIDACKDLANISPNTALAVS